MAGYVHNRCLLNLFLKASHDGEFKGSCALQWLFILRRNSLCSTYMTKSGDVKSKWETSLINGEKGKKKITLMNNFVKFLSNFAWKCKVLPKCMHNQYMQKSIFVFIHLQWAIFTKRETRTNFNLKICFCFPLREEACFSLQVEKYIKIIIFTVNVMHLILISWIPNHSDFLDF